LSDHEVLETLRRIQQRKEARFGPPTADLSRVDERLREIQHRQSIASRQAQRLADALGPNPVQQTLALVGPAGGRTGARFQLRNDQQREIEPEFVLSGSVGRVRCTQSVLLPGESCEVRIDLDLGDLETGSHTGHVDVLDGPRRLLRVWLDVEALDDRLGRDD
jgi:hypothetical protein